jgi:lipoprotein-releasing system permease protein
VLFELFVAIRYLREGRVQTSLILAAVSMGVAVIVFLSALINGLQRSLIDQTLGFQPHVTLRPPEEVPRPLAPAAAHSGATLIVEKAPQRARSIDQWQNVVRDVGLVRGVVAVSPTVSGSGFAARGAATRSVVLRGVDLPSLARVIRIADRMRTGRYEIGGTEVLVGTDLADALGVGLGDKIRLSSETGGGQLMTIGGVFDLGNKDVNQRWIVLPLHAAQALLDRPGAITTIEVKVSDVFEADLIADILRERSALEAESWMKANAQLLVGLRSQNSSKYMIQFFVVIAVTLGIASVLIVSVVQKSREIGILRAFGTSRGRVQRVFLIQGGLLGTAGALLGCAFGIGLSLFFETMARNADGSPTFPVDLDPWLFVGATSLATAIGLAAAVLPARRASALDPAQVIRYG